ncbi:MFS transporter [Streptomyces cheonanensis]|uniref:MFS transporter n=1 Tax=Streptomyces cheonanensis TaxID=312720 RepID=A0ABN2VC80_9ACTN
MPSSTAPPPAAAPPATGARGSANVIVAVLAFSGIVTALMQTLVVPLLVQLPALLDTTSANASWVVTATLLAAAVAMPTTSRLGDMFGKRRIIFVNLGLLIAGSLVCALSDSVVPMVAGRALQGFGMGLIPLGIGVMRDVMPPERVASSMALMSASLGIGGALGLPAAALVAQNFDWHVLFYASAALAALALVLIAVFVPESPVRSLGRFDLTGSIGIGIGLVCLLLALSKGADWGWGSGSTLGLFAAGVLVLALWGRYELRTPEPLVDLRTTARPEVLFTNLAALVIGFAMYAMSLIAPQLLQLPEETGYGLGQSMVAAGLIMAPGGLMMMVFSPLSAIITKSRGPKTSLILGSVVIAAGYGLGLVMVHEVWQVIVFTCVVTSGIAIAYAAMPTLIMGAVPQSETAAANGLNALMRSIGTSTAGAAIGVVLANSTTTFGTAEVPSLAGFRTGFAIACGAAVLAAVLAALIPGTRPRGGAVPAAEAEAEPGTETETETERAAARGGVADGAAGDDRPRTASRTAG